MTNTNYLRRYDIDWLRVIAIGLLLVYHITIAFQPWGVFIGFIQSEESLEWLWVPMSMLNVWRIPLLFFVSGMGVFFAIQKRDWKALLIERSKRILMPFTFGMLVIVPLHMLLWQVYYNQEISYVPHPAHLWFLGNIFIYVLIFTPLFFYLKKRPDNRFKHLLANIFRTPIGLAITMIPFILEAILVSPENFELYALTWHGFFLGMIAFLMGYLCVYSEDYFWKNLKQWKWYLVLSASAFFTIRLMYFELRTPDYLMAIESNLWVFSMFGFAFFYLNKPSRILTYLSRAAYPIYIIHMVYLFLGSWLFFGKDVPVLLNFIMLNVFTLMSCFVTYELLIKRVKFLRPLFGLS